MTAPRIVGGCALVLAAAVGLAYARSFTVPFFFDDLPSIVNNASIREWWRLDRVLSPPVDGSSVTGRPLVNLSFALNYALGGLAPAGYHVVNLLLHAAATLALFGLVRRVLLGPVLAPRFAAQATPLAFAAALLWGVHPLQSESVICVVQRTEGLVGMFYLFTLYAVVRSTQETIRAGWWRAAAVAGAFLGAASKEVMVTAPVLALLLDRAVIAGTFREAWRQRRGLYLGLFASWLVVGGLLLAMGGSRGEVAGVGLGVTPWSYLLKQCEALVVYLRLSLWPHPLVVDYGTDVVHSLGAVLPQGLLIVALLGLTFYAAWRRPALGYLGLWFFLILAPSSSIVPLVSQTMAEHRMYLPLAAVTTGLVLALHTLTPRRAVALAVAAGVAFGAVTLRRSADYQSELSIWTLTCAQRPENYRAHLLLGNTLRDLKRPAEAASAYMASLTLHPLLPEGMASFAALYLETTPTPEMIAFLQTLLRRPEFAALVGPLPPAASATGKKPEVIPLLRIALSQRPNLSPAHANLAVALVAAGQIDEAVEHALIVVRGPASNPGQSFALGLLLVNADALPAARRVLEAATERHPADAALRNQLGAVLYRLGRPAEAVPHFEAAARADPTSPPAQDNLASALAQSGRRDEAIAHYREALRLAPDNPGIRLNLARALAQASLLPEAIAEYETILRAQPGHGLAHFHLGIALHSAGRPAEALAHFEQAVRLMPQFAPAQQALEQARAAVAR